MAKKYLQEKLTAGTNITITTDNVISATGGDVTKEYVDNKVAGEALARENGDNAINARVQVVEDTMATKAQLQTETNARTAADTVLTNDLNAEIATRENADNVLDTKIDTKITLLGNEAGSGQPYNIPYHIDDLRFDSTDSKIKANLMTITVDNKKTLKTFPLEVQIPSGSTYTAGDNIDITNNVIKAKDVVTTNTQQNIIANKVMNNASMTFKTETGTMISNNQVIINEDNISMSQPGLLEGLTTSLSAGKLILGRSSLSDGYESILTNDSLTVKESSSMLIGDKPATVYGYGKIQLSETDSSVFPPTAVTYTLNLPKKNGTIATTDDVGSQVQANWNETDTASKAYIQNKPTIPTKTSELENDSTYITQISGDDRYLKLAGGTLTGAVTATNKLTLSGTDALLKLSSSGLETYDHAGVKMDEYGNLQAKKDVSGTSWSVFNNDKSKYAQFAFGTGNLTITGQITQNGGRNVLDTGNIIDHLGSTSTSDALSAKQGYVLNNRFSDYLKLTGGTLTGSLSGTTGTFSGQVKSNGRNVLDTNNITNNVTSTSTTNALSANQGKVLNDKFASYLPLAGGTMTGAIAMGSKKITGLATPTANTDAATKAYADSLVSYTTGTPTLGSSFNDIGNSKWFRIGRIVIVSVNVKSSASVSKTDTILSGLPAAAALTLGCMVGDDSYGARYKITSGGTSLIMETTIGTSRWYNGTFVYIAS